ncbi:MAG: hypothetical protein AAGC55_09260, partial [Myxococcota bacterium]
LAELTLPDIYTAISNHYPDMRVSQLTTLSDIGQVGFYELMGGSGTEEWSAIMKSHLVQIESATENFHYYLRPGTQHCAIVFDDFFSVSVNDIALVDWVTDLIERRDVATVICPECE